MVARVAIQGMAEVALQGPRAGTPREVLFAAVVAAQEATVATAELAPEALQARLMLSSSTARNQLSRTRIR